MSDYLAEDMYGSYEPVVTDLDSLKPSKEAILATKMKLGYLCEAPESAVVTGGVSWCALEGVSCCARYAVKTGKY